MSTLRTAPATRAAATRRIAVINSNSSASVTAQLADTLTPVLREGTEAHFMNPEEGPAGIDTLLDVAISGVHTAELVRQWSDDFDAFVVACGNDPGLAAAREVTNRPVVGIAEAGILQACAMGARFSVAVLAPGKIPGMRALVRGYGLEGRLASIVPARSSSRAASTSPDELLAQLIEACMGLGDEELGDTLVLTGSVMGRIAPRLSQAISRPVVSGLLAGVRMAETLADAHITQTSTTHDLPQEDS
ncbi:aspartate/glutamate racemase family protein [Paeniglutamicibacter kerguelensis]|uniref:Allantoin racemase n=1 Tax=Paeniglutamicibacter kerguelensis TaxID=254788 RepID=A0ABS4XIX7_9MICC|nr:aspartate/glutamate racemase family protein [Paeniglutamicibacter kerguelensis]MBP2388414.1 allantoin racemase [Paeniglutamicibacter kerguelensis]